MRPGILGEIGVSPDFTNRERASLRGAARAQLATGLPLMVHLPGWQRRGHEVLDMCESEGVDPGAIVLAHMDPSVDDVEYQASLCARRAHLEFDGVGMRLNFPGEGCMPCDEEIARAVVRLFDRGHGDQVLVSQDVFLKVQLRAYGGNGYAHVLRSFVPRLRRLGLSQLAVDAILIEHPRRVFEYAANCKLTDMNDKVPRGRAQGA
jgi:phosphotriesterase-related protein